MEGVAVRAAGRRRAVLRRARPHVGEHAREVVLRAVVPEAAEEPQLVLNDRAAEHRVDVPELLHAVDRFQPAVDEILRQVVGLEIRCREIAEDVTAERVAAFFRDQVDADAAAGGVRGAAAGLVHHLLRAGVVHVALDGAVALQAVDDHPIHQHGRLRCARAVHREISLLHGLRSADVRSGQRDADDQLPHRLQRVRVRHRVEDLPLQNRRARVALHVDNRRLARDGHGLGERADLQLDVDGGREAGWKVNADERGASRFHRDTGQNGAARVFDDSGDGALCARSGWQQRQQRQRETDRLCDEGVSHSHPP